MNIDNLNDDEKFALKVLKVSAVVLVFLSALMIALSVCSEPISETEEYKMIHNNSQFHIISPSPSGRGEAPCYWTSQEVTDRLPSGVPKVF